jgi:hypothetical protein
MKTLSHYFLSVMVTLSSLVSVCHAAQSAKIPSRTALRQLIKLNRPTDQTLSSDDIRGLAKRIHTLNRINLRIDNIKPEFLKLLQKQPLYMQILENEESYRACGLLNCAPLKNAAKIEVPNIDTVQPAVQMPSLAPTQSLQPLTFNVEQLGMPSLKTLYEVPVIVSITNNTDYDCTLGAGDALLWNMEYFMKRVVANALKVGCGITCCLGFFVIYIIMTHKNLYSKPITA